MKQHNVAVLIFDDVEVLDFCGPFIETANYMEYDWQEVANV